MRSRQASSVSRQPGKVRRPDIRRLQPVAGYDIRVVGRIFMLIFETLIEVGRVRRIAVKARPQGLVAAVPLGRW